MERVSKMYNTYEIRKVGVSIGKGENNITTKSSLQDNLCYSTSFWHSILILVSPTVICIPDVAWSWLYRSLAVHPLSINFLCISKPQQSTCSYQLSWNALPSPAAVQLPVCCVFWQQDPSVPPPVCLCVCMQCHMKLILCVWGLPPPNIKCKVHKW